MPSATTDSSADLGVIVLAGGGSSRLGQAKQLLPWRGHTLLEHAIANATALHPRHGVIVDLGAQAEPIRQQTDFSAVTAVDNPLWQQGLAASIRSGMAALPAAAPAVLLTLCDQPLVTAADLRAIAAHWRQAPGRIVASGYRHGAGVPALFPAEFFPELQALTGDSGAKSLLQRHAARVSTLALAQAELDIDTREDWARLPP